MPFLLNIKKLIQKKIKNIFFNFKNIKYIGDIMSKENFKYFAKRHPELAETVLKGKSLMVQAVGICVEFLLRFRVTVDGRNVLVGHACYMIAPRPSLMN